MKIPRTLLVVFVVLSILLLVVAGRIGFLRMPTILRVQAVYCKTQYGSCTSHEERLTNDFLDTDFFAVDVTRVQEKLIESDFRNRRVFVEKIFLGGLTVIIEKRKPIVAVVKGENGLFLIDQEGVVVDFAETSTLPNLLVEKNTELVVGEHVLEDILAAAKILYLVNKSQDAQSASFEKQLVTVYLPGNISAIFALVEGLETKVGALQLIMARSRMDGKLPKTIDLRYSKPVLKY